MPGWEEAAQAAQQVCPNSKIAVVLTGWPNYEEYVDMLRNPQCDVVCVGLNTRGFSKWEMTFRRREIVLKAKTALNSLHNLHQMLLASSSSNKLELIFKLVASQARKFPGLRDAISAVAPSISQLRILESLPDFVDNQLQLTNLRTVAFNLPSTTDKVLQYQTALQRLPSLETLQVFTVSQAGADCASAYLQCLRSLPNVSSLRVATSKRTCLIPASSLQHLTALELSTDVCVDNLPDKLAHLCLEGSRNTVEPCMHLLKQAEVLNVPLSVSLHRLQPAILQHLPCNLHTLSLCWPFARTANSIDQHDVLRSALSQLQQLKVLQLGDFLTKDVVTLLTGLVFPQLHTFGFRIHQEDYMHFQCPIKFNLFGYSYSVPEFYHFVLIPAELGPLSVALPQVQQIDVYFEAFPELCSSKSTSTPSLDCSSFTQATFPKLRGLTCYCNNSWLLLRKVPSTLYSVVKSSILK